MRLISTVELRRPERKIMPCESQSNPAANLGTADPAIKSPCNAPFPIALTGRRHVKRDGWALLSLGTDGFLRRIFYVLGYLAMNSIARRLLGSRRDLARPVAASFEFSVADTQKRVPIIEIGCHCKIVATSGRSICSSRQHNQDRSPW